MGLCDCLFEQDIRSITPEQIAPKRIEPKPAEPKPIEQPNATKVREYKAKSSLMTKMEKEFYVAIKAALPPEYILQPQVNLATIISKISEEHFQNELYRNIDFCIFNLDFRPLVLIEINDETHATDKSRQARDYKVKEICSAANLPLIRFWTNYGINREYIAKRIQEALKSTQQSH